MKVFNNFYDNGVIRSILIMNGPAVFKLRHFDKFGIEKRPTTIEINDIYKQIPTDKDWKFRYIDYFIPDTNEYLKAKIFSVNEWENL